MTDFAKQQQATDTILGHFDRLIADGKTPDEAEVHVRLRFGVSRDALNDLRARRSLGRIGNSGETIYGGASTPQAS